MIYLVVLDFVDYCIHRGQHQFNWWWALHSLHHSQRQMTMWSDNRNHLLDDMLHDTIIVVVGPADRRGAGPVHRHRRLHAAERKPAACQPAAGASARSASGCWISPRFHRLHHSIGIGHESKGPRTLGGHNFGVLLPWWDMLFRTGNFEERYDPTGIRDQVEPDARAGCATTGAASGRSSGWG